LLILTADIKQLEAFHMKWQQRILSIRWFEYISNGTVLPHTGLIHLHDILAQCHSAVFGHVAHLSDCVPANMAVCSQADLLVGHFLSRD